MAKPKKITVKLTPEELLLLDEALDSHLYWQLADEQYRNNGFVYDKADPDANTISDDPDSQAEGERVQALAQKLATAARV